MIYTLPGLQFDFSALEPFIDTQTMQIHYTKHHQAYVDNLNVALDKFPELKEIELETLLSDTSKLPDEIRQAVINNGGGHLNHSFFWKILKNNQGSNPNDLLLATISSAFGTVDAFKEEFKKAALARFGSGWVWVVKDQEKVLKIVSTANQDSPVMENLKPILGLDVWEHAYYLKYQNKRAEYIDAFWNIVNYEEVEKLLG